MRAICTGIEEGPGSVITVASNYSKRQISTEKSHEPAGAVDVQREQAKYSFL